MAIIILNPAATDLSLTASWAGGVLPVAADDVQINEGNQVIDAGLAAFVGVDFGSVSNKSGVTFADDWQFNCTAGIVSHSGTGEMRLDGTLSAIQATGSGRIRVNGGAVTTAIAQTGPIEITDQATIVTAYAGAGDMEIGAHVSDRIDALYIGMARVTTERDVELAEIGAGWLTMKETATISDGVAGGICNIHGGGRLNMEGDAVTIDNLNGYLGIMNPQLARGDITITDSISTGLSITAGADGTFKSGRVIFTNPSSPFAPGIIPIGPSGGFAGLGG